MGLALGIVFDNRHLALSFSIGGAVSGVLAGVVLEYGLSGEKWGCLHSYAGLLHPSRSHRLVYVGDPG